MSKKILIAVVIVIVGFLGLVALQPSNFKYSRSVKIAAPPSDVFAHVNDFHQWENWSPWAKLDSEMTTNFEGPAAGEGSVYSWSGNGKVGEGKMTLVKSQPYELIQIQLDFIRPMQATNMTEFTFTPEAEGTLVTWTMSGENSFIAKVFCLFMDMEKLIGADFDKGLSQLKSILEA